MFFWYHFVIIVYIVVCFVWFCLILEVTYFYCYVYVFLLLCIFSSVYSVFNVLFCVLFVCNCVLYRTVLHCTVLLPPGVNPTAVNIYIYINSYFPEDDVIKMSEHVILTGCLVY